MIDKTRKQGTVVDHPVSLVPQICILRMAHKPRSPLSDSNHNEPRREQAPHSHTTPTKRCLPPLKIVKLENEAPLWINLSILQHQIRTPCMAHGKHGARCQIATTMNLERTFLDRETVVPQPQTPSEAAVNPPATRAHHGLVHAIEAFISTFSAVRG